MRVLRDKLWAKLTALVLFVLLGFLALLRTAQLFSNYMPGDEVGGRVLFIAVCAVGVLSAWYSRSRRRGTGRSTRASI